MRSAAARGRRSGAATGLAAAAAASVARRGRRTGGQAAPPCRRPQGHSWGGEYRSEAWVGGGAGAMGAHRPPPPTGPAPDKKIGGAGGLRRAELGPLGPAGHPWKAGVRPSEGDQLADAGGRAQLADRLGLDLADALARDLPEAVGGRWGRARGRVSTPGSWVGSVAARRGCGGAAPGDARGANGRGVWAGLHHAPGWRAPCCACQTAAALLWAGSD